MINKRVPLKALTCLVPLILIFLLFQVAPLIWVVIHGFLDNDSFSLHNFITIFTNKLYYQAITNSLIVSFWSSLIGIILGTLCAYSVHQVGGRVRDVTLSFSNLTSNFCGVPLAFAFIVVFGLSGVFTLILKHFGVTNFNIFSLDGIVVIYSYFQIPLGLLLIYPSMDNIQSEWKEASSLLGGSGFDYNSKILLPMLSRPILGTFIILFANAMGAYATAYALTSGEFNLLTIRIADMISGSIFLQPDMASAMALILILVLVVISIANHFLLKGSFDEKQ
ncbi:ABC transporter permease subunit [Vibrio sp. S4M6]|uniref:ABC transporter permease n=1 Tax=Vibrio sinus TaxID=2946865 RepID=UPI00202A1561|nr:ABC transporter permease subunit [Vibrio sinus]MCL9780256.1 ABC transporter permease subunit [Vibrio sinus]